MTVIRPPAVAGSFYSSDPDQLTSSIDDVIDPLDVNTESLASAYIVPHAGYPYSGPVAAQVYARLKAHATRVSHVVIVGPSHQVPLKGIAGTEADVWTTPLGDVPIRRVDALPINDAAHRLEHSIEVQLPFLQRCVGTVEVTPIAIGECTVAEATAAIDTAMSDDSILLCSTDLSHFLPQEAAIAHDERTAQSIEALRPNEIGRGDACGLFALQGTLAWAARRDLACRRLAMGTSADTFGTPDRVVGYPAFALS